MKDGQYVFHIPCVANSIRMQALQLSNHLQTLKLKGEITYELKDQAFCYTIVESLSASRYRGFSPKQRPREIYSESSCKNNAGTCQPCLSFCYLVKNSFLNFRGRYANVDFRAAMEAAKAELMNFVGKDLT